MMNGEGPSVPIITLAGIQGLTDLLVELPLPTPLPGVTGHQSLLSHLRDPDEARRPVSTPQLLLANPADSALLTEALANTDTDHIEVKDGYYGGGSHSGQIPQLVQYLLGVNPGLFKGMAAAHGRVGQTDHWLARNATAFNATAFSPREENSPGYFQMEQSPYPPSVMHNNAAESMSSSGGMQGSPQMFNSPLVNQHIINTPQQSPVVMNCMDDVDLSGVGGQNDRTENHILSTAQIIGHLAPSLVSPANSNTNPIDISLSSASQQQQHLLNPSSGVKVSPAASQMQCDFEQWQSAPPNAVFQANNFPADNAYNVGVPPAAVGNSQPVLVPGSEPLKENQAINHLEPKDRNENVCLPEAILDEKLKAIAEPMVVVPKLSVEDQLLAQKSVRQFIKTNNIPSSEAPTPKKADKSNKASSKASAEQQSSAVENSRPSRSGGSEQRKEKQTVNNLKPKDKKVNAVAASNDKSKSVAEPVVVLAKLSIEDQLLAQKSVKQFIKAKKLPVSPERSRHSSPNKVSESSRRRSSSSKDVDSNKSSPRRKSKNDDFFASSNRKNSDSKSTKKNIDSTDARGKKRKRYNQKTYVESSASENENDNEDDSYKGDDSSPETTAGTTSQQAKKLMKHKKAKREPPPEPLSAEDLMDHSTYRNFSRIVDTIFDSMEDVDLSAMIDENAECAAEALIPLGLLQDLRSEVAKLKRLHAINQFPTERLVRLLAILGRNVVDGAKLLPVQSMEEQDEDEARLWLELTMERVMRSAEASLTALYVMTSPKVPEKVFLEDVIERIVHFLKFQLQNTVFPIFDPAYRLDPKSKDGYAGSIKQKRAHAHKVKEKSTLQLYKKLHESVSLLAELLDLQTLTDTIILQVSTLGVSPFFVEGISELQLNALRLVTTVFSRYDKHRQLILEDILASIARLPTSKRSLRNYRLNSEENIQMLTALVLQLIHSVVKLPDPEPPKSEYSGNEERSKASDSKEKVYIDKDVLIVTSYEASVSTAINFLSVFLKKCGTKSEEMDYRPLFEHFVQDLLSTVNKPEWPASELLLSVLGRILVRNFSNKSMDMTLRVASLDYLGVVAARLRKDAVTSQDRKDMINDVIQRIVAASDELERSPSKSSKKKKHRRPEKRPDESQVLQKALLQYLDANSDSDQSFQFCRKFYIAQWYYDAAGEIKRSDKSLNFPKEETAEKPEPVGKSKGSSSSRRRSSKVAYEEEDEEEEVEEPVKEEPKLESDEVNAKVLARAEERKRFLLTVIKNQDHPKVNVKEEEHIDYETAELISQYLASTRHFSKSFDLYLSQILRVLSETAVAVRTKAMKCLTLVVEADPGILSRTDMQKGVHGRLLDQSTSVREAAVDLLGKFILIRPELISQYYEMLTERILDTGVSVRKRVIKILKDICLEQPDFPKTSEICVKIIRRVNDEDGIKKLVGEVFQTMWFTPTSDKKPERILLKVKNITHVVEACRDTGLEWFEQLLTNLLKNKEDANYKSVVKSCKQIVDCLVENLLQLEESSQNVDGGASPHLVACLATLHLFSKIYPPFVVPHATTVQPYLSMKCNTHSDFLLLKNVAQTLELVVPLIEHPSESFLAQIEEDMVKLILRQHMGLLPSCVSCLGAVVNRVTKNHQLVRDCFQKFFVVLSVCKKEHEKNPENKNLATMRPKLLRSLYTVGLFCQHFDFDAMDAAVMEQSCQTPLKDRVFEGVLYFNQHEDAAIRSKALTGLGFIMIRHYEFMLGPEVKSLYHYLLTSPVASCVLKCQVLKNITNYLVEEETRMIQKDAEWAKNSKAEDLKEMGDVTSGMASTVIQLYLKQVLDCVLHSDIAVRKASLQVIQLILGQGLVHPVQILPYLVCLGSDDDPVLRTKADNLLQEIEKKYPGFIQMKAMLGVRMSFKMQLLIQSQDEILRGFRSQETPVGRNGFLYSVMRSTRQSRRAFLFSLLKLFDEQAKTPLTELLYIADNIAYFPYMVQDEPLFIMHQLDIMLSVSGSNLLQSFREALLNRKGEQPKQQDQQQQNAAPQQNENDPAAAAIVAATAAAEEYYDEDDDDYDSILERLPEDTSVLQEAIVASQGCVLLLYLKQTLKEMYGFTDNKIQQYSPNEAAKVYERPLNRKGHVRFSPDTVLEFIQKEAFEGELDEKQRQELVEQFIHFKQLMLTIDPADGDDDEENPAAAPKPIAPALLAASAPAAAAEGGGGGKTPQRPPAEKPPRASSKKSSKSPSHSSGRGPKKSPRSTPKEKAKKKHKKARRRILDSASEDDSDPDYMDSS